MIEGGAPHRKGGDTTPRTAFIGHVNVTNQNVGHKREIRLWSDAIVNSGKSRCIDLKNNRGCRERERSMLARYEALEELDHMP